MRESRRTEFVQAALKFNTLSLQASVALCLSHEERPILTIMQAIDLFVSFHTALLVARPLI